MLQTGTGWWPIGHSWHRKRRHSRFGTVVRTVRIVRGCAAPDKEQAETADGCADGPTRDADGADGCAATFSGGVGDREPAPGVPCFACHSTAWRERPASKGGGRVCGVCHPPASDSDAA